MKILIHAPDLSTPGGKQTYFKSIKDHFRHKVQFFFYGAHGRKESKLGFLKRVLKDYRDFYRLVKHGNFDLVHLNPSLNLKSFFRDSMFVLICKWLRVKTLVFWRGWNVGFENKVVRRILPFFHFTYGYADAMLLLAGEFQESIREFGYTKPTYLGTTVVNEQIFEDNEDLSRKKSGESEQHQIRMLFLARVERVKGIYETIDAFDRLQSRFPDISLDIAGVGGELEKAKQYAAEKGIPQLQFHGWVTGALKTELLHRAHIYVFPSSHGEGMPNSLLEAMASGMAIVTTDVGGIKDFFEEENMGWYVNPHDTDDLEHKLAGLLTEPDKITRMGSYNINFARHNFSPKLVTRKLEQIYEKTTGKTKVEVQPARHLNHQSPDITRQRLQ